MELDKVVKVKSEYPSIHTIPSIYPYLEYLFVIHPKR